MAGKVYFSTEYCKGCGLCISVCPKHIIVFDEKNTNQSGYHAATVEKMEDCIGCGSCAKMCPDSVITVERV